MAESKHLSKAPPAHESMDFAFLRNEGISLIQKLSGNKWTDHNIHDPGITILEILCYAITELGFKTNIDIKDILAEKSSKNESEKQFFTAREILPNAPLTIQDYRKQVIDLPGIRNAWFEKSEDSEINLFWNEEGQINLNSGTKLSLKGLYNVLLEFEEHPDFGDLNHNQFIRTIFLDPKTPLEIDIAFPFWDDIKNSIWENYDPNIVILESQGTTPFRDNVEQDYFVNLIFRNPEKEVEENIGVRIKLVESLEISAVQEASLIKTIEAELVKVGNQSLIGNLCNRLREVNNKVNHVKALLHNNRNIGEDFFRFKAVRVQEIGIHANVEISQGSNVNDVLAKVFFEIYNYFSPRLRFYSLNEQLNNKKKDDLTVDKIFDGPLLSHGFIDIDELEGLINKSVIYTSDLVRLIMGVTGVEAVMNVSVSNYINNKVISPEVENCLRLPLSNLYKPALSISKSKITFTRNSVNHTPNQQLVRDKFEDIKKTNAIFRPEQIEHDLPVPKGAFKNLSDYYSLQNEFPLTYGIGMEGIEVSATETRKAQAKQIKAYLLFFEQILANYLAQLSRVKDLFSIKPEIANTYFWQPLYNIPQIQILLKPFIEKCQNENVDLTNENSMNLFWNSYKEDFRNELSIELEQAIESRETFTNRRNRFLDHLLARFGEDLTEYSLLTYGQDVDFSLEAISDKIDFIKNYTHLSSKRGQSFNYLAKDQSGQPDLWNSENVSGLEKRTCAMLGIKNYTRRNLSGNINNYFETYQEIDEDNTDEFRFRLIDPKGNILLSSTVHYSNIQFLEEEKFEVIRLGTIKNKYRHFKGSDGKYYFHLVNEKGEIVARRIQPFEKAKDAKDEIDNVVQFFKGQKFEHEGFYMVEHILLRPRLLPENSDEIVTRLIAETDNSRSDGPVSIDPYSFCLTFIFPSWPVKFSNPDFKAYADKVIRSEVPAHILPEIYWIDEQDMMQFETVYKTWLNNNLLWNADQNEITNKQWLESTQALIEAINKYRDKP